MSHILLIYSSVNGQTEKIMRQIEKNLVEHHTTLIPLKRALDLDITSYDRVLIGASIRYGNYRKELFTFVKKHKTFLTSSASGFFSVNLTARKAEKATPQTNRYIEKFLQIADWKPKYLAVFAGALQYSQYNWWQTRVIQMIMKITGGSTDTSKDIEFTDWNLVDHFACHFMQ